MSGRLLVSQFGQAVSFSPLAASSQAPRRGAMT